MCLACFSSPAGFLKWMVKVVQFLSRLLNASCSDVITVPLLFSLLPNRPRPLSSFDTHARWKPVTQSAQSRWSYGKIEDCEQSRNFLEAKNSQFDLSHLSCRYTFQTLWLVGHLGVCLGAEWRIFGALIVECTLRGFRCAVSGLG